MPTVVYRYFRTLVQYGMCRIVSNERILFVEINERFDVSQVSHYVVSPTMVSFTKFSLWFLCSVITIQSDDLSRSPSAIEVRVGVASKFQSL